VSVNCFLGEKKYCSRL